MKSKQYILKIPTYTEIFESGQEKIIANLSQEGLAEKFIVFTTSISSLLFLSHLDSALAQIIIMKEFEDALRRTDDGHKILNWLLSNNLYSLNINNYTLMEMYCILLRKNKSHYDNDKFCLTISE